MKVRHGKKTGVCILILALMLALGACGGGGGVAEDGGTDIEVLPDFTPSADSSLAEFEVNTFKDNGINVTTDPTSINFVETDGELASGDVVSQSFTLTNSSGSSRTFKFQIYAVSSGFTVLDENKDNVGAWQAITLGSGESETFYIQFTAELFGTQTSYLTITADVDGYIRLPFRATVTGDAEFRLIPTGYNCSDDTAPSATSLDFLKVAYGKSFTKGVKLCNTGGEDVRIISATMENDDSGLISQAMETEAFTDFDWSAAGAVESVFATGSSVGGVPVSAPAYVDCGGVVVNPVGDYSANIHNGDVLENVNVTASSFLWIDVEFSPSIDMEAGDGELCDALSINAKLRLDTSLGVIELPLLGATAGSEPILEMYYRLSNYSTKEEDAAETDEGTPYYRPIDLTSEGAAIIFNTTQVFADWVSEGYESAEILIKNNGTGSKNLKFSGGDMLGFFEYESDVTAGFPLELAPGASQVFSIHYAPTPDTLPEEATWDFGQMHFTHNAGNNGPEGKITLVGEEEIGYAVELTYSGADMRKYSETDSEGNTIYTKNFCVINTEAGAAAAIAAAEDEGETLADGHTQLTFTIKNNSKMTSNDLAINWSIEPDSITSTATDDAGDESTTTKTQFEAQTGSLSVSPDGSSEFTITMRLNEDIVAGETIMGKITVTPAFNEDVWNQYEPYINDAAQFKPFVIPFQATASDSGAGCIFDSTELAKSDFKGKVTFVIDRLTMVLTDLTEDNRSYPSFKFHLPLEIDAEAGTVRVAAPIVFDYSGTPEKGKQMTSPLHQSSGISGCATLPTNPYRLREERYSWSGPTASCGELTAKGTQDGDITIYGDWTCMPNDGGKEYIDPSTGQSKVVFYSEFGKIDEECEVRYYGKFSTFAFDPKTETIRDVMKRSEEKPNENDEYYEEIYGGFRYDTYITFLKETTCGGVLYAKGNQPETITDIDAIKACYAEMAADTIEGGSKRADGMITECAEFNFNLDEGVVPDEADMDDPDKWIGFGTYEPHVDDDGNVVDGQYDMTVHNVNIQAFVLGAADRVSFFGHPGHLLYSDLQLTLSTKRTADGNYGDESSENWQERIAPNTRPHFTKDQVFLMTKGGNVTVENYFTDDGINNMITNMINPFDPSLELGKDRGNFQYTDAGSRIVLSGRPVNLEQNNMLMLAGLGSFGGVGNTAPPFTKKDAATGRGKSLYFVFHGCLVNTEDPDATQGCQSYSLDSAAIDGKPIVETYVEEGMIRDTTLSDIQAFNCEDPGQEQFGISAVSVPCINYTIYGIDRNRYTNYYDPSNNVVYDAPDQYSTDSGDYDEYTTDEKCGVGM